MKSIQQKCQLGEEELKSVFRKDGEEFSELLLQNIDFSEIRKDLSGIAEGILRKKYRFGVPPHYRYVLWFSQAGFPTSESKLILSL